MKVKHTVNVRFISGKEDHNQVFARSDSQDYSISRQYVYPKITENNNNMGTSMKNLSDLFHDVSHAFLQDGQTYAERYYKKTRKNAFMKTPSKSAFNYFLKAMFAWQTSDPEHVDLKTLCLGDIIATWTGQIGQKPIMSWTALIDLGFLPRVSVYADLTSSIN